MVVSDPGMQMDTIMETVLLCAAQMEYSNSPEIVTPQYLSTVVLTVLALLRGGKIARLHHVQVCYHNIRSLVFKVFEWNDRFRVLMIAHLKISKIVSTLLNLLDTLVIV